MLLKFLRTLYRGVLVLVLGTLAVGGVQAATDCVIVSALDVVLQTEISQVECESLLELYHSTDGPNWTNNEGWNVTNAPCSWFGVTCNAGYVTEIYLNDDGNGVYRGNGLTGQIPDLNLPNLEILALSRNQLTGSIPDFNHLPNLQQLSLGTNQLTGSVPDFSHLPKLQSFSSEVNQLTGTIPNFNHLPNLQAIWLGYNQLTGPIPDFSHLFNLTGLLLINNSVCKDTSINYSTWQIENRGASVSFAWLEQLDSFPYCSIENKPPIASFTAFPSSGTVPLDVQVNASSSNDPDGRITGYEWQTSNGLTAGGLVNVSFYFATAGNYTITLTVTDNGGRTGKTQKTVTVTEEMRVPDIRIEPTTLIFE